MTLTHMNTHIKSLKNIWLSICKIKLMKSCAVLQKRKVVYPKVQRYVVEGTMLEPFQFKSIKK